MLFPECQSARMSKITNASFIAVSVTTVGIKGLSQLIYPVVSVCAYVCRWRQVVQRALCWRARLTVIWRTLVVLKNWKCQCLPNVCCRICDVERLAVYSSEWQSIRLMSLCEFSDMSNHSCLHMPLSLDVNIVRVHG